MSVFLARSRGFLDQKKGNKDGEGQPVIGEDVERVLPQVTDQELQARHPKNKSGEKTGKVKGKLLPAENHVAGLVEGDAEHE